MSPGRIRRERDYREPSWMCVLCGYVMDAAGSMRGGGRPPQEDDYSLCLNCGHVYVRHDNRWVSITAEERAAMSAENRHVLEQAERGRRFVIREDLAKRGGRA